MPRHCGTFSRSFHVWNYAGKPSPSNLHFFVSTINRWSLDGLQCAPEPLSMVGQTPSIGGKDASGLSRPLLYVVAVSTCQSAFSAVFAPLQLPGHPQHKSQHATNGERMFRYLKTHDICQPCSIPGFNLWSSTKTTVIILNAQSAFIFFLNSKYQRQSNVELPF